MDYNLIFEVLIVIGLFIIGWDINAVIKNLQILITYYERAHPYVINENDRV